MPANLITLPPFSVSSAISSEFGRGSRQCYAAEVGKTGLHFSIDESRIDLLVELVNYLGGGAFGAPTPHQIVAS
jgi:hypothetical protein